jgi:hypothetical protein
MKLLKESLNFKRETNHLSSLGVGKSVLIKKWLDEMNIKGYTINEDLTIDVDLAVNLIKKNLKEFPEYIQFNKVSNNFYCNYNMLTSLRGCPYDVGRNFYCNHNNLTSLDYFPKKVGNIVDCSNNDVEFSYDDVERICNPKNICV